MDNRELAPDIFRKRLLIEGYFNKSVTEVLIEDFFKYLTKGLSLKTYGPPIIHATNGTGKEENQGFDAFIPLIDSGIYLAVWKNQKFISLIIYTCKDFDDERALELTRSYFDVSDFETKSF